MFGRDQVPSVSSLKSSRIVVLPGKNFEGPRLKVATMGGTIWFMPSKPHWIAWLSGGYISTGAYGAPSQKDFFGNYAGDSGRNKS